jgi:peptide deformylase
MSFKRSDLKILVDDHPLLLEKPLPWSFEEDGMGGMVQNLLIERMKELGGVGLSANQVGIPRRVFVIGMNEFQKSFFNPVIVKVSKEEEAGEEGCLSFPGIFLNVKRPKEVTIKYQDVTGEWFEEHYVGLTAKVILHEYDHMEGITFKSRVSTLKWNMATKKKDKKIKRIINQHVKKQLIDIHKKMEHNKHGNDSTRVPG